MSERWHSCKKGHPKHGDDVLLLIRGAYYLGYWDDELERGHWRVHDMHSMFDMKPTHWVELLKRPRGVKEE